LTEEKRYSATMPWKPKTSPVIRATRAALESIERLRDARLEAARDDVEREKVETEHRGLRFVLATILHEAQFGPPAPAPTGLHLVRRDPEDPAQDP